MDIAMSEEADWKYKRSYGKFLAELRLKETEHFSAIGLVASEWAGLEVVIDRATVQIARIPQQVGFCLTAQIAGIGRKLDAYIAIVRHRVGDGFLRELKKFKNDATGLAEPRNRVVHDPWIFHLDSGTRHEITAKGELRNRYVEVPTADIEKLHNNIYALSRRFKDLHNRIRQALQFKVPYVPPPKDNLEIPF